VRSTVFLPGDEETLSLGMPALLKQVSEQFDLCIGGEPTSKQRLGDCIKIGRRGRVAGTVTLKGRSGHAAYADITPNLIHTALPLVIEALGRPWGDMRGGTETTLSITNLSTDSTALNVIPGAVTLSFDARSAPGREPAAIEAEVRRRLAGTGVPFELGPLKMTPSYMTDPFSDPESPHARLVTCATAAVKKHTGETPILTCDGGTSDARFVGLLGIPTIECGVPHGNMHGADEFVRIADIETLRAVYCDTVKSWVGL
jgi:succinyl-diaminopimelate desuccinylase